MKRRQTLLRGPGVRRGGRKTAQAAVEVDGRTIPLEVSWHERARRFTLRLDPRTGGARLTIPPYAKFDEAVSFLSRHEAWLVREQARLKKPVRFRAGVRIPVRGEMREIRLDGRGGGRVRPGTEDGRAVIHVAGEADMIAIRVARWLRAQARADIERCVARHAERLGVSPKRIVLRDQRTRWGSCSQDGSLSFSWRLVLAPPEILDYVAAHEVAHLKEMNHGPRFWRLLRDGGFDVDHARRWLTRNGPDLHRYGSETPARSARGTDEA